MKALTVRQPWCWAILHAGKDVENRSTLWQHRGPLAIHAGGQFAPAGFDDDLVVHWAHRRARYRGDMQAKAILEGDHGSRALARFALPRSAVVGVVDVIDAHRIGDCDCTSNWAQPHAKVHVRFSNPRPLTFPVDCSGSQGMWDLSEDVKERVLAQVAA